MLFNLHFAVAASYKIKTLALIDYTVEEKTKALPN
jgi:hypothetical protein